MEEQERRRQLLEFNRQQLQISQVMFGPENLTNASNSSFTDSSSSSSPSSGDKSTQDEADDQPFKWSRVAVLRLLKVYQDDKYSLTFQDKATKKKISGTKYQLF